MSIVLAAVAVLGALVLVGYKPLASSTRWRATLIPLASIMGSGFLVSAPLLANAVGIYAVFAMSALLALAFCVGGALRFNIRNYEPIDKDAGLPHELEAASQLVLAGAYFISVSYYIQLLAAFALNAAGVTSAIAPPIVATVVLSIIGLVGTVWGLDSLARVEKYAVGVNLAMIGALLIGLIVHNGQLMAGGTWALPSLDVTYDWDTARVLIGLLIVVQGFETSRYIGEEFPADVRVKTMRDAQLISTIIYVVFLGGATVLFETSASADVTAVIAMVAPIAPLLPVMLTVAALGSQFSAAVADDAGGGGLIEEITHKRISPRVAYGLLWVGTIVISWATDVTSIIAWASRAFALFYAIQCLLAAVISRRKREGGKAAWFMVLSFICLVVCLFGKGGA